MNIRQSLILQSPSLALQRAAADEISKLDAYIKNSTLITEQTILALNMVIKSKEEVIANRDAEIIKLKEHINILLAMSKNSKFGAL